MRFYGGLILRENKVMLVNKHLSENITSGAANSPSFRIEKGNGAEMCHVAIVSGIVTGDASVSD